ncbi:hypothetical protein EYF80_001347 [Liparis tanakae]|uniref:Uncharacterized protein n=1 Tax=Liparis tanakae TaxID=230148 RepID=A0A4Z2JFH3_9TELE|nr:hypothetical protein EYF80_001347 [Liparis tanakae]
MKMMKMMMMVIRVSQSESVIWVPSLVAVTAALGDRSITPSPLPQHGSPKVKPKHLDRPLVAGWAYSRRSIRDTAEFLLFSFSFFNITEAIVDI